MYVNEPNVIEQLKDDAIGESITNITRETCENVTKSILRLSARLPKLFANVILMLYSIRNVQVLMNLLYRKPLIAGCDVLSYLKVIDNENQPAVYRIFVSRLVSPNLIQ